MHGSATTVRLSARIIVLSPWMGSCRVRSPTEPTVHAFPVPLAGAQATHDRARVARARVARRAHHQPAARARSARATTEAVGGRTRRAIDAAAARQPGDR